MKLNDAIFNWLQIKVVAEARPTDQAAQDTFQFFTTLLEEDHGIQKIDVVKDDMLYRVTYWVSEEQKSQIFDGEAVDFLLESITNEPKFNEMSCIKEDE